jgi:hypothetical protein
VSVTIGGTPAREIVEWAIKKGLATRPLRLLTQRELYQAKREQLVPMLTCAYCGRKLRQDSQKWGQGCPFRETGLTHEPAAAA